jgi:single-stranded DNA-binding protein
MSYDQNECHLSGKVENFTIINTKTGTPMIRFSISCNKERLTVVAFKGLADDTRLNEGDQVSIIGAIQSTSWEGKDGVKKYGFQFIASSINGVTEQQPPQQPPPQTRPVITDYQGGPF